MPSSCEFEFNKNQPIYYSGEIICGTITLITSSDKRVRDIRIIFRGEGKVHWTDTERRRKSDGTYVNETIHFRSNETYVDNDTKVVGEGTLPPGTHTYTFQIILPIQCPTSCEESYGNIRYELILKINRAFQFDNKFSKPLTVIRTQDLNLNPVYKVPIVSEEIFSSCCFSCTSGKINTTFTIPFGAYAIGQNVKYSLYIQNQSMDDINGYTVKFIREITFTATSPHHDTRDDKLTLYKKYYDTKCLRLTTRSFSGGFIIPSTPPSTEDRTIIRVRYFVKLFLEMSGCNFDKEIRVPIFIGTVALRESLLATEGCENFPIQNFTPTAPELPLEDKMDKDLPPAYKELGPPTFEEATSSRAPFIDSDKDAYNRHIGFRPLYPSYSFNKD
ncbi:arrestin domain-containing protein 3-like isoform 2-T2 [Cochliomyia hominivorax]